MKFEPILEKLLRQEALRKETALEAFRELFSCRLTEKQAKSLLLLLARKGETVEELAGCLNALREAEPPVKIKMDHLIDTCGSGGDGSCTINVSTLAAILVAGAGGKVAKHGNRAISSRAGSSDLMEALGVNLEAGEKKMLKALKVCGLAYFHAPYFHPVFSRFQPLRKALATRTIFNLLGPLVNPVTVERQMIGVSRKEHLGLFAGVLRERKVKMAFVCHSRDGMDEISGAGITDYVLIKDGRIRSGTLDVRSFGLRPGCQDDYRGGDARQNSRIALDLLNGKIQGPIKDLILLNAAAGLWISGLAKNIPHGLGMAADSLGSGRALQALRHLIQISREK